MEAIQGVVDRVRQSVDDPSNSTKAQCANAVLRLVKFLVEEEKVFEEKPQIVEEEREPRQRKEFSYKGRRTVMKMSNADQYDEQEEGEEGSREIVGEIDD